MKGYEAALGMPFDHTIKLESSRDRNWHGTHTESTGGGSFSPNASYHGLAYGTVRGGPVHPSIGLLCLKLIYLWWMNILKKVMTIDQAVHDGIDILSMSLGGKTPIFPEVDYSDGPFASFDSFKHGIIVVCSAGNKGPLPQTVGIIPTLILTVAASSIDRFLPTLNTIGNNQTFVASSLKSFVLTRI